MPHAKPVLMTLAALLIGVGAACSIFNATPSGCIAAAENAGLPDSVIEQLRNSAGLSAVERVALRKALVQAGIDDVCDIAAEDVPSSSGSNDAKNDDSSGEQGTARNGDRLGREPAPSSQHARIPQDDENRRRCKFWALNNLQPVAYSEFAKLNPDTMDDLDRILWRSQLHGNSRLYYDDDFADSQHGAGLLPRGPGIYCRDFWAEPLNRSNAELRNKGFEPHCRFNLEEQITNRYRRLADVVSYEDNELVYDTPNQYMRVLEWLDLSGDDLINSDNPPYRILLEQSRHQYAYADDWIPTKDGLADYTRETGETLHLEWLGIVAAAGLSSGSSDLSDCHYYYPQLFYGYWVPFDPDQQMPDTRQLEELELPRYEGSTTPIYLPRSVTAEKIRAGYPLGKTAERYYLCLNSSDTENVSYYYVDHPAGDYCELKP